MKYIVKKPFGNVKVGEVLEEHISYDGVSEPVYKRGFESSYTIAPHELALMLNAGFLEESDGKWRPKNGETYWSIATTLDGILKVFGCYCDETSTYDEGNCFPTKELAEAKLAEIKEVLRK
jgi:hypothetical protein